MIVNEIAKFWKPPIAAEELLRVAELMEDLLLPRRCGSCPQVVPVPSALPNVGVVCTGSCARSPGHKRCQRVGRHER